MRDPSSLLDRAAAVPRHGPDIDRPYRRARRRRQTGLATVALALVLAATTTAVVLVRHQSGDAGRVHASAKPPTTAPPNRSWHEYRDSAHRLSVPIAPGWFRPDQPTKPWLVSPGELLSLATTHLAPDPHNTQLCVSAIPKSAVDAIGPHGAYLWLGEWHPSAQPYGTTPNPRPAHFADASWNALCPHSLPNGMSAYEYTFTDAHRDFTVDLLFGPDTSTEQKTQAYEMLDRLQVRAMS